MLLVPEGVRCPPLPVHDGAGDVGDLGMHVQLHVTVSGGVLQPVRHRQVGLMPLPGLPAVDPGGVRAGPGVPGLPPEVPNPACTARQIIASISAISPAQYASPSASPAWRANRAFSPSEAWKIEIDLENETVRSKYNGLGRARPAASTASSRWRSAVACGSAASSFASQSAAARPPDGGLPSRVPSGALRSPNSRSYGSRSTTWPSRKPRARAPGPHHRPGGSPPPSAARM